MGLAAAIEALRQQLIEAQAGAVLPARRWFRLRTGYHAGRYVDHVWVSVQVRSNLIAVVSYTSWASAERFEECA